MKKLLATLFLSTSIALAGCGANTEEKPEEPKETTSTKTEEALFRYTDLLPDYEEIFPDSSIDISDQDGGKAYIFTVNDATKEGFLDYSYACKEEGFVEVWFESGVSFGAYTEGGTYWVETHFDEEEKTMMVIVNKGKKDRYEEYKKAQEAME